MLATPTRLTDRRSRYPRPLEFTIRDATRYVGAMSEGMNDRCWPRPLKCSQVAIFGTRTGLPNIEAKYPDPLSGGKCLSGHALLKTDLFHCGWTWSASE